MTESASDRYMRLKTRREPFLQRAREAAKLTIPSLMPPEGHNGTMPLPQPNQGFGSLCVITLSSRIASALMPPSKNFLRLSPTPEALIEAGEDTVPSSVEVGLAKSEKLIASETNRRAWRKPTNLSAQLLVATGNALEQMLPDNSIRVFRLDQYVVTRDPSGRVVEIIVEENLYPDSLTGELKEAWDAQNQSGSQLPTDKTVPLYTWVQWDENEGVYQAHQELGDKKVRNSEGTYEPDVLPFFPLRYSMVAGEDYGRGKVEEHIADFIMLDGLSKAINDGSAMASRNVTMVRPGAQGGVNLLRKIAKAHNGEYVVGNPEDVEMLQFQNTTGLQVASAELEVLRRDLGKYFLLSSTTTRDAERVTATEVRMAAEELEGILGGVYTMLSQDMMLARTRRLVHQMKDRDQLPDWPEEKIEPVILTGLDALGREAVVNQIMTAAQALAQLPEMAHRYPKWDEMIRKLFIGLDIEDAVKTETEVQDEMARERRDEVIQQTAAAGGEEAARAAANPPQR